MPTDEAHIKTPNGWVRAFGETVPPDELDGYAPGCIFVHTDGTNPADVRHTNYETEASCQFLPSGVGGLLRSIDETVDLTAAGAKFVAMATAIPTGALILGVQANIEVLVVAGGTSVKIGLGSNGADMDKYGLSASFVKNIKINTIPAAYAVLAAPLTLDVSVCTTTGAALGDTNVSAGSVRVRVIYLVPTSLPDAA